MLVRQRQMLRQIADNKQLLLGVVKSRPFVHEVIAGQANFVLLKVERADDLLSFCARRNVILRGFPSEPLLRGYIRIARQFIMPEGQRVEMCRNALDACRQPAEQIFQVPTCA